MACGVQFGWWCVVWVEAVPPSWSGGLLKEWFGEISFCLGCWLEVVVEGGGLWMEVKVVRGVEGVVFGSLGGWLGNPGLGDRIGGAGVGVGGQCGEQVWGT